MAITEAQIPQADGETMYERLESLVTECGEVMVRLDSGEEAELHRHNVVFESEPWLRVTTADAVHWINAEKIEHCWIHYDF